MEKKIIISFFIIGIAAVFTGCYYDKAELVYPPQNICDTANVKYSTDIVSIFSANCYACHSGSASAGGGIKLDAHANVLTQVTNGKLANAITHSAGASAMPKNQPKMPACNINRVLKWINSGAPNN